jgi:asparagine synthase (glutamine-hydrolysing)
MRRLSIIDLSTGHQPISNEDGTIQVVFNGEIYNYQELRPALEAQGHHFATHTDTETLVHLYEQEGVAGLQRLRGMFAYAVWDSRLQQLFIARDRMGKKPLYYARLASGFYFASEIKSLKAAGVPLTLDEEALRIYLQFGYVPEPRSIYREVRKLQPAHWLTIDRAGNLRTGRYWRLPPPTEREPAGITEEQVCEEIRSIFDEAVRLRMISDVPLGAFLSGGIDSGLVVATMARQSSSPVRTFSIGWEEQEFNELPLARVLARTYHTEHHEIVVRPDVMTLVPALLRYFDEPFADVSAIPTYLVSQFAAGHVKVVLSGDGGDELFGGYHSFFWADSQRRYDRIPAALRGAVSAVAQAAPYWVYGKNYLHAISRPTSIERYFESISFNSWFTRERTLEPQWRTAANTDFYHATFDGAVLPDADPLSQAMYFEGTAKLAGDILTKVDRMSMANSLEVRSPLLDHCLAELAARIPNKWKTRNGKGKLILLKALSRRLPPELLSAPKRGFGVPLTKWFRGPLREMVRDMLTSSEFQSRGITRPRYVEAMLEEHDSGRRNHADFLWQLLVLELWFRESQEPVATVPVPAPTVSRNA